MNERTLLEKLEELLKVCDEGLLLKCKKFAKIVQVPQAPQKSNGLFLHAFSVAALKESLDYFRICMKYQVFDLEATRRENEYLRKLLQENNR